ncbi:MAG: DMT family transporter [Hyphomicrobiales bacterium]|nr:DMT family transporter [Hyphomicrobiales bacterium]MBV8825836.1 DMT family transporter [Hyphomicrobiales bacterium]
MDIAKGIALKLASLLLFAVMSALIRGFGHTVPVGQVVFFRSVFALVPVVIIYAARGEFVTAVRTHRLPGHLGRGVLSIGAMFLSFAALTRLPLIDATAISFAAPLIVVALAALILKERVQAYSWGAVAIGFCGVIVMLTPYLDLGGAAAIGPAIGALFALLAALCNAGTAIETRRLTETETTSAIVFYFSVFCTLAGLVTLPFAWHAPTELEFAKLVAIGVLAGVAHILLTEGYQFAPASVLAPFEYTAMVWASVLGYLMFGETPTPAVLLGGVIVAAAGLIVIWREHRLGLERPRVRVKAHTGGWG